MDGDTNSNPLVHLSTTHLQVKPTPTAKCATRARKARKHDRKMTIQQQVGSFDVVRQLANTSSGLKFKEIQRGDDKDSEKEHLSLFSPLETCGMTKKAEMSTRR